jgi:hypothetical protein
LIESMKFHPPTCSHSRTARSKFLVMRPSKRKEYHAAQWSNLMVCNAPIAQSSPVQSDPTLPNPTRPIAIQLNPARPNPLPWRRSAACVTHAASVHTLDRAAAAQPHAVTAMPPRIQHATDSLLTIHQICTTSFRYSANAAVRRGRYSLHEILPTKATRTCCTLLRGRAVLPTQV